MHSIPHLVGGGSTSAGSVLANLVTYRMQHCALASQRHKDADTQCHQSSLSMTLVMTELGNVMVPHRSVSVIVYGCQTQLGLALVVRLYTGAGWLHQTDTWLGGLLLRLLQK